MASTLTGEEKMATSFPLDIDNLGTPFVIIPNTDFPTETTPLCILSNLGTAPAPDGFITIGANPPPNDPDPWQLEFHWETVGAGSAGLWQLDAFLQRIDPGPSLVVPGFPILIPGGSPTKYAHVQPIAANAIVPGAGLGLYRLYTTIRWLEVPVPPIVRLAGRGIGPLIEFFLPV